MKRTYIWLAAAMAIMTWASCKEQKAETKKETNEVIPVKVMELTGAGAEGTVEASGHFTTDNSTYLSFKVGGYINKILVKEGDKVTKGQLLATLDLTEINSMVNQYRLGFEKAKRDYERVKNLYNDSVATLEQFQNAKTGYDLAAQQLKAAEFNLAHSNITAQESGFILKKMASEGQLVNAGMPVLVANGVSGGNWMLRIGLSDKQWSNLKVGDKAEVFTDTRNNGALTGKVLRKSEGIDPMSGVLTADIALTGNQGGTFAEGMFGKAVISTTATKDTSSNGYVIPYDAILDADGRTGYVFVTKDGSTAHKVRITIDKLLKNNVLVTGGLDGVQKIIVSGSAYLNENSPIHIIQ